MVETPNVTKLAEEMVRRHGTPITLQGLADAAIRLQNPPEPTPGFKPHLVKIVDKWDGSPYYQVLVEDEHTLTLLHLKGEQAGFEVEDRKLDTPAQAVKWLDQIIEG